VNWYDCVKWVNARSQREYLTPCYYVDAGHTVIYKSGNYDIAEANVDWTANGYRLPTEAEWERAARGGASGHRYPWADDTIRHSRANYFAAPLSYDYDTSPTSGYHPDYTSGGTPHTSPVGSFAPNGYGLYNTAGNLWEWSWDWYGGSYYASSPGTDPRGPASGSYRVLRGGGWNNNAVGSRVADRAFSSPGIVYNNVGFRLVRAAQ